MNYRRKQRVSKGLASLASAVKKAQTAQTEVDAIIDKVSAVPVSKEDKFDVLKKLEATLNKQFDTTKSLVFLGSKVGVKMPHIATNLPSLDNEVLMIGGIPRGRIIEIYGPESAGKTTLALHIIAEEQKNTDNLCAIVDAEHALDPNYAAQLGVNVNELLISQPDSGEQALETVDSLIDSGTVSLIVVDSVAALVPQAELDGEMGDSNMGLQARLLSQAMRKLRGKASIKNVTVIFINQIREKIGVLYGSPEVTTGGRALKFFSSVRLDVRRRELLGTKEDPLGHELEIKCVKNKVGTPFHTTKVNLVYGLGLDKDSDFIGYAVKLGIIERAGAWYKYENKNIGQGLNETIRNIKDDAQLFDKIHVDIEKRTKIS